MKIICSLVKKEFLQIIRDPSSILIAFILPFILLLIFATAINLDNNNINTGLLIEGYTSEMNDLVASFENTKYLNVTRFNSRSEMIQALMQDKIKAMIIFPNNFSKALRNNDYSASVQLITDATDPNIATFVSNYVQGTILNWTKIYGNEKSVHVPTLINIEPIIWFNPELESRNFILPGSIAVIMTLVGMILTALVIAREWERGTMEALLTTQATKFDFLIAKYIAYYGLAMCSTIFCTFLYVQLILTNSFRTRLLCFYLCQKSISSSNHCCCIRFSSCSHVVWISFRNSNHA